MNSMKLKQKSHALEFLFPLVLFGVFAVMSLFLVIIGSEVYSRILDNSYENGNIRTSVSYLANKLRAADSSEVTVYTTQMSGTEVLVIEENYGDFAYQNLIYYYENAIRETMIQKGWDFQPEFGDVLVFAGSFKAECLSEESVVAFYVTDLKGRQQSMEIAYRSGYIR